MNGKADGLHSFEHIKLLYKNNDDVFFRFHNVNLGVKYANYCNFLTNRKDEDNFLDIKCE